MNSTDPFPTFHELRLRHGLSLEDMYQYAEKGISLEEIRLFDETGRAVKADVLTSRLRSGCPGQTNSKGQ